MISRKNKFYLKSIRMSFIHGTARLKVWGTNVLRRCLITNPNRFPREGKII
jgi:hypothetical protein